MVENIRIRRAAKLKKKEDKRKAYFEKREAFKERKRKNKIDVVGDAKARNQAIQEQRAEEQRQKDLSENKPVNIKGELSGKTYTITQRGKLSDQEVIQQNKQILNQIDKQRQRAKAQGNTARERELSQQYNDIARVTNTAIKEENKRIGKAQVVSEFANLYPSEKAAEIVEQSGLKEYLFKKEVDLSPPPRVVSSAEQPVFSDRFVYDKNRDLWIDTTSRGSGSVFGTEADAPASFSYFSNKKPLTFTEKFKQELYETRFEISESKELYASKTQDVASSSDPLKIPKGLGFAGVSTFFGAKEFVLDLSTQPQKVGAGFIETAVNPVGTLRNVGQSFSTDPFGTIGYLGAQGVTFSTLPKSIKATGEKGLEVYSEYKFEKGRVYESKPFEVDPEGSLLFDGQTQLQPKSRGQIIGDFRSQKTNLKPEPIDTALLPEGVKSYFEDQAKLPRPVEVDPLSYEVTPYKRGAPINPAFETFTLESGGKVIREKPAFKEVLSFERALQESSKRGTENKGIQTQLPEGTKSDIDFFIVDTKSGSAYIGSDKGSLFSITNKKGSSLIGSLELIDYGSRYVDKFLDQSKRIRAEEPLIKKSDSVVSTSSSVKGFPITSFYIGGEGLTQSRGQELSLSPDKISKIDQSPVLETKTPTRLLFEPVSKLELYQGVKVEQLRKTKSKVDVKVLTAQDVAQAQDSKLQSEQLFKQTPTDTFKLRTPEPVRTFQPETPPIPPPRIIKPKTIKPDVLDGGLKFGFKVAIRRKGRFTIETAQPLRREEALQFGASKVGRSSAATFKLIPSKARKLGKFSGTAGNLRDFYKKGSLYIEKRGRRIKSREEKEEITLKGLTALRTKKKGLFGRL